MIRENTFESAADFAKHYQETWGEATITERTDTCLLGGRVEVVAELAGVFDDILSVARGHICSPRPAERTALHGPTATLPAASSPPRGPTRCHLTNRAAVVQLQDKLTGDGRWPPRDRGTALGCIPSVRCYWRVERGKSRVTVVPPRSVWVVTMSASWRAIHSP